MGGCWPVSYLEASSSNLNLRWRCHKSSKWSGARFSKVPESFRAQKAISKTMQRLISRAFYFKRFAFTQSLHLCDVSKQNISLFFSYGLLKLAFRVRKLSGNFKKRSPGWELNPGFRIRRIAREKHWYVSPESIFQQQHESFFRRWTKILAIDCYL